jgi:hypothetical protein
VGVENAAILLLQIRDSKIEDCEVSFFDNINF